MHDYGVVDIAFTLKEAIVVIMVCRLQQHASKNPVCNAP